MALNRLQSLNHSDDRRIAVLALHSILTTPTTTSTSFKSYTSTTPTVDFDQATAAFDNTLNFSSQATSQLRLLFDLCCSYVLERNNQGAT